jgi:hypothetical protein
MYVKKVAEGYCIYVLNIPAEPSVNHPFQKKLNFNNSLNKDKLTLTYLSAQ